MNLTDPIFHDENKAREHLEAIRWPNGPYCPHCGNADPDKITKLAGKSHRAGLHQCNECTEHFTVTVGSVMERSHIPLHKWVLGFHLMSVSKKGVSAHQLWRTLGLGSYRTAWFMAHRVREAMKEDVGDTGPLGGEGKVVEVDETYFGKLETTAHSQPAHKARTQETEARRFNEAYCPRPNGVAKCGPSISPMRLLTKFATSLSGTCPVSLT